MTETTKKTTKAAAAKKPVAKKPAAKKVATKQPVAKKAKVTVETPTPTPTPKAPKAESFTVALPMLPKFDVPKPHLDPLGLTKVDRTTLTNMARFELPKFDLPKFDLPKVTDLHMPKVDLPKVSDLHMPKVDATMVVERATHAVDDARRNVTHTVTLLRELVGR